MTAWRVFDYGTRSAWRWPVSRTSYQPGVTHWNVEVGRWVGASFTYHQQYVQHNWATPPEVSPAVVSIVAWHPQRWREDGRKGWCYRHHYGYVYPWMLWLWGAFASFALACVLL